MNKSQNNEIFFATSFSGHVDYETNLVHDDFKDRISKLLNSLREVGKFSVYCAVESEGWRISDMEPGVSMATNFENIESRSIFLALVDKVGSDGRGVEIEHAYNSGSRVLLATGPGEELGWVMKELVAMGRAEHIPYVDSDELAFAVAGKVRYP
jgi:hypothetical protein